MVCLDKNNTTHLFSLSASQRKKGIGLLSGVSYLHNTASAAAAAAAAAAADETQQWQPSQFPGISEDADIEK